MDKIVTLNVGGQLFTTAKSTLITKSEYFANLLSNKFGSVLTDHQGHVFVDRDPTYFAVILNALRTNILDPRNLNEEILTQELIYYGINFGVNENNEQKKEELNSTITYLFIEVIDETVKFYTPYTSFHTLLKQQLQILRANNPRFNTNTLLGLLTYVSNNFNYKLINTVVTKTTLYILRSKQ